MGEITLTDYLHDHHCYFSHGKIWCWTSLTASCACSWKRITSITLSYQNVMQWPRSTFVERHQHWWLPKNKHEVWREYLHDQHPIHGARSFFDWSGNQDEILHGYLVTRSAHLQHLWTASNSRRSGCFLESFMMPTILKRKLSVAEKDRWSDWAQLLCG